MIQAVRRNSAIVFGLILTSFVGGLSAQAVVTGRGAIGPLVLEAEQPVKAWGAVALCVILCTGIAAGVGRLVNTAVGLFVLGWGLGVLALRMATVREVAVGGMAPSLIVIETVIWAAILAGTAVAMFRLSGPLRDIEPVDAHAPPSGLVSPEALKAAAAGILMLPVVWLLAQTPMKGQVIGTTFVGGMIAGLAGRFLAPNVQPVLLFASPCLFGAVGQLIAIVMLRSSLLDQWITGSIPPLLRPMPIDYAAGSLTGVAVGLGWAKSFLHHEPEHEEASPARAG